MSFQVNKRCGGSSGLAMIYVGLYSPTSVQRVVDFVKTVYAFSQKAQVVPVIVKPIGAAAQIGIPEAFKVSVKLNKPFMVFPELGDALELLRPSEAYFYSDEGTELEASQIRQAHSGSLLIVFPSGESEPSKKELAGLKLARLKDVPSQLPALALLSIFMYKVFYQVT
ncbi:MAG: RecB-family nuclease [Thermogladius sp.]